MSNKNIFLFVMGAGASYSSGVNPYTDNFKFLDKEFERFSNINTMLEEPQAAIEYYENFYSKIKTISPSEELELFKQFTINPNNEVYILNQNVDGLLNKLGVQNNYEIHGNIHRNKVFQAKDGKRYMRPDVVMYGENLNDNYDTFCSIGQYWYDKLSYDEEFKNSKIYVVYWGTSNRFEYTDFIKNFADVKERGFILEINPKPVTGFKNYNDFFEFHSDFLENKIDY